MSNITFKNRSPSPASHLRVHALEEAHEAVVKLRTLKPFLSPQDEETLAILMDKTLLKHLEKSLKEADEGKIEPLKNILK